MFLTRKVMKCFYSLSPIRNERNVCRIFVFPSHELESHDIWTQTIGNYMQKKMQQWHNIRVIIVNILRLGWHNIARECYKYMDTEPLEYSMAVNSLYFCILDHVASEHFVVVTTAILGDSDIHNNKMLQFHILLVQSVKSEGTQLGLCTLHRKLNAQRFQ